MGKNTTTVPSNSGVNTQTIDISNPALWLIFDILNVPYTLTLLLFTIIWNNDSNIMTDIYYCAFQPLKHLILFNSFT